jgi:hypothetical protein
MELENKREIGDDPVLNRNGDFTLIFSTWWLCPCFLKMKSDFAPILWSALDGVKIGTKWQSCPCIRPSSHLSLFPSLTGVWTLIVCFFPLLLVRARAHRRSRLEMQGWAGGVESRKMDLSPDGQHLALAAGLAPGLEAELRVHARSILPLRSRSLGFVPWIRASGILAPEGGATGARTPPRRQ